MNELSHIENFNRCPNGSSLWLKSPSLKMGVLKLDVQQQQCQQDSVNVLPTSGVARNFQEGVRNCVIQGRV